ncbi:MAG: universal stress protein [Chloroflexi bacterium]|nr:universal stress protein [Chloroflexota bacterium]
MKILVTTDGSERSLCVLPHAARFATATGAELILMRVLDPRTDASGDIAPSLEEALVRVRERWTADLRAVLAKSGVAGETYIAERKWGEDIPTTIHRAADETAATLLAMDSRGTGALRHALLGSVTMGVISKADLPVMSLGGCPPPPGYDGIYHLLITSDGSPDARSVFGGLGEVLAPGKVKVTLLQVVVMQALEPEAEAEARGLAELRPLLERVPAGVEASAMVRVIPPAAGIDTAIAAAAADIRADAIATATYGHSARRHLVAGSTALGVVKLAEVPVILVKSHPVA